MRVYIYGIAGNMAGRYSAILHHLGHSIAGCDLDDVGGSFGPEGSDGIIVATPTETHTAVIRHCLPFGKPILCEKPICKDLPELRGLMADVARSGVRLQMVSQYDHLPRYGPGPDDGSCYDYFRTGPDGLPWDALQIIWHAKDTPRLAALSPVWKCRLNGQRVSIADMDQAYVTEIKGWIAAPRNDLSRIIESHEKVAALEARWSSES